MFTPLKTGVGALLLQFATTNFYWQNGQTVGFSSLISGVFSNPSIESYSLISGVLASAVFIRTWLPEFNSSYPQSNLYASGISDYVLFVVAGLLVGFGTRLGNGCTSGHMIGGLSRLRLRSLVATGLFFSSAVAVVRLLHLGFENGDTKNYFIDKNDGITYSSAGLVVLNGLFVYLVNPTISRHRLLDTTKLKAFNAFYTGLLFGIALHISGMVNTAKTIGFLAILTPDKFDPSLVIIVIFTIIPNIFIWKRIKHPLLVDSFKLATATAIPPKFVFGNVIFGAGWGLLGVCPGPGLINSVHHSGMILWLVSFVVGSYLARALVNN